MCVCSDKEQGWRVLSRSYHVIMWKLHFVLTAGRLPASRSRTLQQVLKGSSPHPPTSCLSLLQEFKAVSKEDSGRYSCLASNKVGTSPMCEGKHMTIGVCVRARVSTPRLPSTPFSTGENQRCSREENLCGLISSQLLKYEPTLGTLHFKAKKITQP